MTRSLTVALAVLLTTSCAVHRASIPNWERYQQGELAGFLRAPGELAGSASVSASPVRRARGKIDLLPRGRAAALPAMPASPTPLPYWDSCSDPAGNCVREAMPGFDGGNSGTSGSTALPPTLVVVELRGPEPRQDVRTVATYQRSFDFDRLPDGVYTLKATTGTATTVARITVSHSADSLATIRVRLWWYEPPPKADPRHRTAKGPRQSG